MLYSVSGGGYLPPHIDEFFANLGVKLLIGYGLTETSPIITMLDEAHASEKMGSIGRPASGAEVKLVDDSGAEVPEGEVGEIATRGPHVMKGYFRSPDGEPSFNERPATAADCAGVESALGDAGGRGARSPRSSRRPHRGPRRSGTVRQGSHRPPGPR